MVSIQPVQPVVAIIGSARQAAVGNRENDARLACFEIGVELANAGWSIAVYSSDDIFIEPDVVRGYASVSSTKEESIICHRYFGMALDFPEIETRGELFKTITYPSDDWEVSFYRSLAKVDGLLVIGGGSSSLVSGHIGLMMGLPIITVAEFGGSGKKIWKDLSSEKGRFSEEDIQCMASWGDNSAKECVSSLIRQHQIRLASFTSNELAYKETLVKAKKWDDHETTKNNKRLPRTLSASTLVLLIVLLILGFSISSTGWLFTTVFIFGLCLAGGVGATIRYLTPRLPKTDIWNGLILGNAVGLVLSLLYLLPQLIGSPGFLNLDVDIDYIVRVQYLSALIVAFLAGVGFDYSIEHLIQRAKDSGEKLTQNTP